MPRRFDLTIDCADAAALARFWADALDYPVSDATVISQGDDIALVAPEGLPVLYFQRVPEGKVAKNRVHLDVHVGGTGELEERRATIDAEAARLVALGASDGRGPIEEAGTYWVRMNDPEGNEFCLVNG